MRFSTIASSVALPLAALAAPIKRQTVSDVDILVLQFAEVLERLELDFYQQGLEKFSDDDFLAAGITVPDVARQNLQGILEHETAHAKFLQDALDAVGGAPVEGCRFNFDLALTDVNTMAVVARVVETAGVAAYAGASILVEDKSILLAAATILTIEARHQSFLNTLNGATSTPQAFDLTMSPEQVLALAGGFIEGCDLGIVPNKPLFISNDPSEPVGPGTLLTFEFDGQEDLDEDTLSCQMIVGGLTTALSFPISECIVPEGINGPVSLFITNDPQPLIVDIILQNKDIIEAGPTIAFIDIIPDALGNLVREGGAPVESSEDISQDEAQDQLDDADNTPPDAADSDAADSESSDSEEATETSTDAAAPTDGAPATPENAAAAPADPPIKVIGQHTIPA